MAISEIQNQILTFQFRRLLGSVSPEAFVLYVGFTFQEWVDPLGPPRFEPFRVSGKELDRRYKMARVGRIAALNELELHGLIKMEQVTGDRSSAPGLPSRLYQE